MKRKPKPVKKVALTLKVSCDVIVEVPEGHPLLALRAELSETGARQAYWSDGRYPWSVELQHEGAVGVARGAVQDALFHAIDAEFETKLGKRARTKRALDARNAAVSRAERELELYRPGKYTAHAGRIEVSEPFDLTAAYNKLCGIEES